MQAERDLCKQLFVKQRSGQPADANYLVSCFVPYYSEKGSSRRVIEEEMIDFFQDVLMSMEDQNVTGYVEDLTWSDEEDSLGNMQDNMERMTSRLHIEHH